MIAGVISRARAVRAAGGDAHVGLAVDWKYRRLPLAVAAADAEALAVWNPAPLTLAVRHAPSAACNAAARAARSTSAVAARIPRRWIFEGAQRRHDIRDAPARHARSAPPPRRCASARRHLASLPVMVPRRPPTHTVTVMSEILRASAGGDAVVGKARVRFDRGSAATPGISAPAVFACASTVSQIFRAASRVSITAPPCSSTVMLRKRAGGRRD